MARFPARASAAAAVDRRAHDLQDSRPVERPTGGWSKPRGGPRADWTITDVAEGRVWASACRLPGGALTGVTTLEDAGAGLVRCTKTVRVTGPLVPLFRLWFGPRIRRDQRRTFAALETEAARRTAAA